MSVIIITPAGIASHRQTVTMQDESMAFAYLRKRARLITESPILTLHPSEWADVTPTEGEGGAAVVVQ